MKKIVTKNRASKKKTTLSHEVGFYETGTLTEERQGKCVICFPIGEYDQGSIDEDIGLIGLLMMNFVQFNKINRKNPEELTFEYDKKYMKKILSIEKKYFDHKIKIDAKSMSDLTMFVVNRILPGGPEHNLSGKPMAD